MKKFFISIFMATIFYSYAAFSQDHIDTSENLTNTVKALNKLESKGYSATVVSLVNNSILWPPLVSKGKKSKKSISDKNRYS